MKVTAISFALIFFALISLTSAAIDFTFSSPASVEINESFPILISATTSDKYDVKIFVQDNETTATISEIYDSGWRNPFKYILSAFPDKSSFDIRAIIHSDKAQICVRLRKTDTSSPTYTKCAPISIVRPSSSGGEKIEPEEKANKTENIQAQTPEKDFIPIANSDMQPVPNQLEDSGRIVLNSKSPSDNIFVTKDEKLRQWAVYSFTFLTILIVIFLALKKL